MSSTSEAALLDIVLLGMIAHERDRTLRTADRIELIESLAGQYDLTTAEILQRKRELKDGAPMRHPSAADIAEWRLNQNKSKTVFEAQIHDLIVTHLDYGLTDIDDVIFILIRCGLDFLMIPKR